MAKLTFWVSALLMIVEVTADYSGFEKLVEEFLSATTDVYRERNKAVSSLALINDPGVYSIQAISPVASLCFPALSMTFIDVANTTYAICVSGETSNSLSTVTVGLYYEHVYYPITSWYVGNPQGISAFYDNGLLYVLVADLDKVDGPELVKINLTTGETIVDHTVRSNSATSIAIWKMETYGKYHMAVAGSKTPNGVKSEVLVYEWMDTYFDNYSSFSAYDVRDIEPFHIHGAAYLAIANFQNGNEADSEIRKYDLDKNVWHSHQKIRTSGATDWEFFTLGSSSGKEFFLALANYGKSEVKSMVYKFVKDKFVPFQCLPTSGAVSLAAMGTMNGDRFLLAVASAHDGVHFFTYDGWRFVATSVQYTRGTMSAGVKALSFHNVANVTILGVSNPYVYERSVFEVHFRLENSLQQWHAKSTQWCMSTLQQVDTEGAEGAIRLLDGVFFADQTEPIVVNGNLHFGVGFRATKISTPKVQNERTKLIFDGSFFSKLETLRKKLKKIHYRLKGVEEVLRNSLKTEGPQTVIGKVNFRDVHFKSRVNFHNITTTILNDDDVNWDRQLIFLDEDQNIGTLFPEKVHAGNIFVQNLVDGVNVENLVTKSSRHSVTALKNFAKPVYVKELEIHGSLDGIKVSPDTLFLTTGYQTITGNMFFEDLDTQWLTINDAVNGINLKNFYEQIVFPDQSYTIRNEKTFSDVVADELTMTPGSTINDVDIADLWQNVLWKDGYQEIKAPVHLSSAIINGDLHVSSGINDIDVAGHRVVETDKKATIIASKIFEKDTRISKLAVKNSINGIKCLEPSDELDIMLKEKAQKITGIKTFQSIHLDSDSYVTGNVDGIDLSELKSITLSRESNEASPSVWTFNNIVVQGPLIVRNNFSGVDLDLVYEKALKLSGTEIPRIIFRNVLHVEDLQSDNVNGVNIKEDLVLVNEPQVLSGSKHFEEISLEENSIILGLVNDVNITFLNDTLLKMGNQIIESSKIFSETVKVNLLYVNGTLNGIPIADVVRLSDGPIASNARILTNVTFSEMSVDNLNVGGRINGVDVPDLFSNTLLYDDYQTISGTKILNGPMKILSLSDSGVIVNGIDLRKVLADAVYVDIPQIISGTKVFTDAVHFRNIDLKSTLDGVSEWDLKHNWMLKDVPQIVEADVTFANGFYAKNLDLKNTLDGINVTHLNLSLVKMDEFNIVEGPLFFLNDVISTEAITLNGEIQGVDLSEEALTKGGSMIITGDKTFTDDLVVEGHISVDGLVAGVSVTDICANLFYLNSDHNVSCLTVEGDVTLLEEATVGGTLAGVNLTQFNNLAIFTESALTLDGLKTFSSLTIDGPMKIEGKFGGIDLNQLNSTYLSLNLDQTITGSVDFQNVQFEGTLAVDNFYTPDSTLNGIDLKTLDGRILKTMKTGVAVSYNFDEIVFAEDLFVAGKVNGLSLPNDVMRRNRTNYIYNPKVFEQTVHVLGDLNIERGKKIQEVDVSYWNEKSVLKKGSFPIHGSKTFNDVILEEVTVSGLLDGLIISQGSLLMVYGQQMVTGSKNVIGDVKMRHSLVGELINGVDIEELDRLTAHRDRVNKIAGVKYFKKPLNITSLQCPTLSGVDVIGLSKKLNEKFDFDLDYLEDMEQIITDMHFGFENQAVIFQYYEKVLALDTPGAYLWHYTKADDMEFLILSYAKDSSTFIRIFNYTQNRVAASEQEFITTSVIAMKSSIIGKKTYLFVANRPISDGASVDIYTWAKGGFEIIQTLIFDSLTDIAQFTDGNRVCVICVQHEKTSVYCTDKSQEFTLHQDLISFGGKVSVLNVKGKPLMAITSRDMQYVNIYVWNRTFEGPKQVLGQTSVQSMQLMKASDESVYLAVVETALPNVKNLLIFKLEGIKFVKYQTIEDSGKLDWIRVNSGELLLFVLDSTKGLLNVYQLKGISGFVRANVVEISGCKSMHLFKRGMEDMNHYLAFACTPKYGVEYAKFLKSKVKGRRLHRPNN